MLRTKQDLHIMIKRHLPTTNTFVRVRIAIYHAEVVEIASKTENIINFSLGSAEEET